MTDFSFTVHRNDYQRAMQILDSYASLLVLLLANFFLLEVVEDKRWGVIGSPRIVTPWGATPTIV